MAGAAGDVGEQREPVSRVKAQLGTGTESIGEKLATLRLKVASIS